MFLPRIITCLWRVERLHEVIGNFRIQYEFEFSIPVCRLYIITSHVKLIPGDFLNWSIDQQWTSTPLLIVYQFNFDDDDDDDDDDDHDHDDDD